MDMFFPLGFRSYFSLCQGVLSPEEICSLCLSRGYRAAAMIDTGNFYGAVRFLQEAARQGVKPVLGVEVRDNGRELFTAIVKNRRGFYRINRILTWLNFKKFSQTNPRSALFPAAFLGRLKTYDPLRDLAGAGWDGLFILSPEPAVLKRLPAHDLFVKLAYGRPFQSLALWARQRHLPVIAAHTVVFGQQEDAELYGLLRAIDLCVKVDELPEKERLSPAQVYLPAEEKEVRAFFSALPEALDNLEIVFQQTDARQILNQDYVFPRFYAQDESDERAFARLTQLCYQGLARRFHDPEAEALLRRLEYELDIIRQKGFASYFLVVHDIVGQCERTCGRGSSASSLVSYLLGITHVDPIAYNLFFERFLNLEREQPPDIDVDFPWDERDKIFAYVFSRYRGRAGMVANQVRFGGKGAVREVAKACGLPDAEIERLVRVWRLGGRLPEYISRPAGRLKDFPRYLGTHCGGVVVTPRPITWYTPLQVSPQGLPVIAWEKEQAEDCGLVKIDLLGNRSLAVLRDTLKFVSSRVNMPSLYWSSFNPLRDRATQALIEAGKTIGIFYVESPATRQLLQRMQRGDYEHLVIASSIIRPAANRYISEFVSRLRGEPYQSLHPLLEKTLAETYGIMVYQEDISRVAIALCGLSPGQADRLRKLLSRRDRDTQLPQYKEAFFAAGTQRGVSAKVLGRVWDMILSFQGYSFCKSHSASYALVSYRLAYLKNYFPLEFMTAVINNRGGYYSTQTYLNETRRMGFAVLGPQVNASAYPFTIETITKTAGEPAQALRIGFCQLKGLDLATAELIVKCRSEGGKFADSIDFMRRCRLSLEQMRILIRAGALDGFGFTRPQLFWQFYYFDGRPDLLLPEVPGCIGDYATELKQRDELRYLGLVYSVHPLDLVWKTMGERVGGEAPFILSRDLSRYRGRSIILAGLLVTGKEILTRKGEKMLFLSFEDSYSVYETVLFPQIYRECLDLLDRCAIFLVAGKVEEQQGALSVHVQSLIPYKEMPANRASLLLFP